MQLCRLGAGTVGEAAQRLESANANNERLESHNKQLLEEAHPIRIRELADEQMRELRRVGACCDATTRSSA